MAPSFQLTDGTVLGGGGGAEPSDTVAGEIAAVTATEAPLATSVITLTLTDVQMNISNTGDFGTLQIADFGAARRLVLLGVDTDLTITKDGGGAITTTNITMAIGTTQATNQFANGANDRDIMRPMTFGEDALVTNERYTEFPTMTATTPVYFPRSSASSEIWLNCGGNFSSDNILGVTGTIKIFCIDIPVAS